MKESRSLFISDLHLCEAHPNISALFFKFLQVDARQCDALYILGDFFEQWIGDDHKTELHQSVLKELKALTRSQVPVYFIHGNRDFLIGKRFAKETGMTLLPDPSVITLYKKKIMLSHGDYLCVDDHAHQTFRRFYNNRIYQRLFLLLPITLRLKIANKARATSKKRHHSKNAFTGDINPEFTLKEIQKHACELLIHGHTHRPCMDRIHWQHHSIERIVLPAWEDNASYLDITPSMPARFVKIDP